MAIAALKRRIVAPKSEHEPLYAVRRRVAAERARGAAHYLARVAACSGGGVRPWRSGEDGGAELATSGDQMANDVLPQSASLGYAAFSGSNNARFRPRTNEYWN
jgi:hypothetical protein